MDNPMSTDWRNDPEVSRYMRNEWCGDDIAEAAVAAYKRALKTRIEGMVFDARYAYRLSDERILTLDRDAVLAVLEEQ